MIIVARTVFHENNRYCPQVFIYECLYKKILEYDKIKMSEDTGVNKPMVRAIVLFAIIGTFLT